MKAERETKGQMQPRRRRRCATQSFYARSDAVCRQERRTFSPEDIVASSPRMCKLGPLTKIGEMANAAQNLGSSGFGHSCITAAEIDRLME